MDGGPETALKAIGRERWSIEDAGTLRDLVYQQQRSPAGFAPSVLDAFEAADPVATAIVTNQVAALATRVAWLAARADCGDRRLVIFGGLTARDSFTQALDAALASVLPGWTTERPSLSPVEAAVQRAASM
jgi:N-acetylglucosamine kinase-like BadF-type ATPase